MSRRSHIYEGKGDIRQNPANLAPIGTGPFKFVHRMSAASTSSPTATADYWRHNVALSRPHRLARRHRPCCRCRPDGSGPDPLQPVLRPDDLDSARLGKDPRFIVSTKGNEGNARTNTIEFNFRRKELADIRVRRAIAHALDIPFFIENFLGDFAKRGTGPIPSVSTDFYPADNGPQYPFDKKLARQAAGRGRLQGAAPAGRASRCGCCLAPWGEDITLWSPPSSSSRWLRSASRVEVVRTDGGGFLKQVYDDHAFDLATGWHQYRNDPAVSTTVWYRSGQPKGAPWTNQWDWTNPQMDKIIDDAAAPRSMPPSARRSTRDFVRRANTELPIWTPIEQIFLTAMSAKARNHSNTPRWGSSSWARSVVGGVKASPPEGAVCYKSVPCAS